MDNLIAITGDGAFETQMFLLEYQKVPTNWVTRFLTFLRLKVRGQDNSIILNQTHQGHSNNLSNTLKGKGHKTIKFKLHAYNETNDHSKWIKTKN